MRLFNSVGVVWTVGKTVEMTVHDQDSRGRFISRNDAYRRGVAAKAALKAEIIAELGGDLSTADEILLTRAVELLVRRQNSRNDAVRATNTANRILRALRARYWQKKLAPTLEQMLAEIGK